MGHCNFIVVGAQSRSVWTGSGVSEDWILHIAADTLDEATSNDQARLLIEGMEDVLSERRRMEYRKQFRRVHMHSPRDQGLASPTRDPPKTMGIWYFILLPNVVLPIRGRLSGRRDDG